MAARGNKVIISNDPKGVFLSGIVVGTPKPGTVMEIATPFYQGGLHSYQVYQPGTDGLRNRAVIVLLEDDLQGLTLDDAATTLTLRQFYVPAAGEELNMLFANVSGTADDHAVGEVLIVDTGTGKLIATTGSPQSEPFINLAAVTDPTADFHNPVMYIGK